MFGKSPDTQKKQDVVIHPPVKKEGTSTVIIAREPNADYYFRRVFLQGDIESTIIIPYISSAALIALQWLAQMEEDVKRLSPNERLPYSMEQNELAPGEDVHVMDTENGSKVHIEVSKSKDKATVTVYPQNGKVITVENGKVVEKPANQQQKVILEPGTANIAFPIVRRNTDGDLACREVYTWVPVRRSNLTKLH